MLVSSAAIPTAAIAAMTATPARKPRPKRRGGEGSGVWGVVMGSSRNYGKLSTQILCASAPLRLCVSASLRLIPVSLRIRRAIQRRDAETQRPRIRHRGVSANKVTDIAMTANAVQTLARGCVGGFDGFDDLCVAIAAGVGGDTAVSR